MTAPIQQFRGDTLDLAATYLGDNALPAPLVGVTITAWVQTRDAQFAVTTLVTDTPNGLYRLRMTQAQTTAVPAGIWPLFVRYAVAGDTETDEAARVAFTDPVA